ncbi:VOC family protein [Nocardia goodfellowii]
MITAVHTLVYADDPDAARAFFRDVLRWPHVDAHDGGLIFGTGPSELGVHPAEMDATHHEIALLCDDITATVDELADRGAKFDGEVVDRGFGGLPEIAGPAKPFRSVRPRLPRTPRPR